MQELVVNTRVRFIENPHSYLLDDTKELKGVTTLMKDHNLSADYSHIDEEVLDKATKRGSKVHKDIEMYCKGEAVPESRELKAFISLNLKTLANEYLVSDNEIVASQIDIVTQELDIIDIKTTSTLHIKPLQWQLSIYAYLFELQTGLKANKLYGLHIKGARAKMVEIKRLPDEEVKRLLECERFDLPFVEEEKTLPLEVTQKLVELKDATSMVTSIKEQLKMAEMAEKALKEYILSIMEKNKDKVLEMDGIKVTYIEPSIRESIDKDKLKENYPDIYERYLKVSPVSSTLRISLKV